MAEFEVIIIGAGIAGLSCAEHLEKRTLIIEKQSNPYNHIACAEWVPLNFPAEPIQKINSMLTIYPGGQISKNFPGKIIDRKHYQTDLLNSLNCTIHLGENVLEVIDHGVKTNKGFYTADHIICANGPVSDFLNNTQSREFLIAANFRMKLVKPIDHTVVLFNEKIELGYAWCFPKGDIANVGVGVSSDIKQAIDFTIDYFKSGGLVTGDLFQRTTGLIPLSGLSKILEGNIIRIGDAGGFIDPITGAGIAYARDSGILAAGYINGELSEERFLNNINTSYRKFLQRKVSKRKIMEAEWYRDLSKAIEKSWISFSPG